MFKKTMSTVTVLLALLASLNVYAANKRYFVIYKSDNGFKAMDNFMKLESSKAYGSAQSLKHLNSMIVTVNSDKVVESLKKHPEVDAVVEEYFLPAPKPLNGFSAAQQAQSFSNTVVNGDPASFAVGEKTPWGILTVGAPQAWALADAGSQSRVLVVDTGIDVNHASLKGNFEKAKNFVSGNPLGGQASDPNDVKDEVGHGTHCSGTVAAQYDTQSGFVGVAPKAKILMGKVCSAQGCSMFDIAAGINWGIEEKVDVISMSLGGPRTTGNPLQDIILQMMTKPMLQALDKAEKAGIFTVAATGNSAQGEKTPEIGYPAAHKTVYAVGAIDNTITKTGFSQYGPELDVVAPGAGVLSSVPTGTGRDAVAYIYMNGQKIKVPAVSFAGTKVIEIPRSGFLVDAGLGKADEFAKVDVKGKFALVQRGEIKFTEKVQNAMKAGALGLVTYNNAAGLAQGVATEDGTEVDFAAFMIEQKTGLDIVAQLKTGQVVSAEVSTVKTDYALFDGTSMATPHVAGVAALAISAYKKAHGGQTISPANLRALLSKTAKPLVNPNGKNMYGAGVIQADAAVVEATK